MIELAPFFSILGFLVVAYRLGPSAWFIASHQNTSDLAFGSVPEGQSVSIIVPARNEEANLPKLLESLRSLEFKNIEIIVVDDNSTDGTGAIVEKLALQDSRIHLLRGSARPQGWSGKTWACQQAAELAKGDYLLFTDADTQHRPLSLSTALSQMKIENLDMLSAIPFHAKGADFDAFMGPFHLLLLISSSAFSKPTAKRVFAIGQYLLFKRDSYFEVGAHTSVKESFSEDLDLARAILVSGRNYGVNRTGQIFKVRMYDSFSGFVAGWRRIIRLGLGYAQVSAALEVFLVIACLFESFRFARATVLEACLAIIALLVFAISQRRYGSFFWFGVLLTPISVAVFTLISVLALFDRLTGQDLRWRGRSYSMGK